MRGLGRGEVKGNSRVPKIKYIYKTLNNLMTFYRFSVNANGISIPFLESAMRWIAMMNSP